MQEQDLVVTMVGMLGEALEEEGLADGGVANGSSPLLGADAILTSMGLVILISDIESVLEEELGIEVTLVSEDAFSRRKSPFRSVDALANYILELTGSAH